MKATCLYCGLGCAINIEASDNRITAIRGVKGYPTNDGRLCGLAVNLPPVFNSPNRLKRPMIRKGNKLTECEWGEALDTVASGFQRIIRKHGPDAVAFYGGATNLTEEYYVMNKLMKGGIGTNNMECSTRICMASSAAGFISVLGADAPPACYDDIDISDCFLICGNNMAVSCPVLFSRLLRAKKKRNAKMIVVDPRRTPTAVAADLHLAIRPGTDVALNNAMAHVLFKEGYVDEKKVAAFASGLRELKEHLAHYAPEAVAPIVGSPAKDIRAAARMYGEAGAALTFWFQGYNHSTSALWKNNSLHNLAILTGNIGRPGGGPLSITGESNALGNRYVGALCHLLPGMRQVVNPEHREEIAAIWGIPFDRLRPLPGKSIMEMIQAILDGTIKALWVMNTNPAVSIPHTARAEKALSKLELLAVQDIMHPTETNLFAHVLMPAAQWYEKEGTVITSERRVEYIPKVIDPPGEARPDWKIMQAIAERLGHGDLIPYETEEEIFREWRLCSGGKLCDMTGINYERLRGKIGVQLPCPSENHPGTPRLFTDLRFPRPDGRAALLSRKQRDPAEMPDDVYPFILLTGRIREHFNTRTRTAQAPELNEKAEGVFAEIHPQDAEALDLTSGDRLAVISRRGRLTARARITDAVRAKTIFVPWHYGRLAGPESAANRVTNPVVDPNTQQPEYKFCAVKLEKIKK